MKEALHGGGNKRNSSINRVLTTLFCENRSPSFTTNFPGESNIKVKKE